VKLKVFVLPNCPKCPKAKKIVKEVAEKFGLEYEEIDLSTSEGEIEGLMYQIVSTPSIALDEDVITRGILISKELLESEVRKRLEH
jgi:glutaredoxin